MIDTLNNLQPAAIIFLLGFFFTLESFIPHIKPPGNRLKHTLRNLILVLLCFAANGVTGLWLKVWIGVLREYGWGLMNAAGLDAPLSIIAGVVLIDLDSYCSHILFHRVGWLWRVHRVHHSDSELDSTSALRFHPLETFIQAIWRTATFALIGVSVSSLVVFYSILLPLLFIQHANIRLPGWMERYLGAVFVLSGWHKVHHSDEQRYCDSHYGNAFTVWDKLFGTSHSDVPVHRLSWGLKEFNNDRDQTVKSQMLLPFRTR